MKKRVLPCADQNANKARRVIKEVLGKCAICAKRKKAPPKNRARGLMTNEPSDVIAMCAAELTAPGGARKDLGMTCYGCADECFQGVPRRAPRTSIWEIWFLSAFREWSFLFGAHPKRLVTDRGSEFINRTVADSGVSKRDYPLGHVGVYPCFQRTDRSPRWIRPNASGQTRVARAAKWN